MADDALPPELATELRHGVDLFNRQLFWDAHEAWEHLWLDARGPRRRYIQGLIQLAAAYVHLQRGTFSGAVRLFDAAMLKLSEFENPCLGVDRSSSLAAAEKHRFWVAAILETSRSPSNDYSERLDANEYPKLQIAEG